MWQIRGRYLDCNNYSTVGEPALWLRLRSTGANRRAGRASPSRIGTLNRRQLAQHTFEQAD
jgi:hypothetical protein